MCWHRDRPNLQDVFVKLSVFPSAQLHGQIDGRDVATLDAVHLWALREYPALRTRSAHLIAKPYLCPTAPKAHRCAALDIGIPADRASGK